MNDSGERPPEDISKLSFINWIKEFGVLRFVLWVIAIGLSLVVVYLLADKVLPNSNIADPEVSPIISGVDPVDVDLPQFSFSTNKTENILRRAIYDTDIPVRQKGEVTSYTVEQGDSLFGIAEENSITPETLLWANFSVLNDNPDEIVPGMVLNVPPVNGVYYQWQNGDSFESVATNFETYPEKIVNWFGNKLDLVSPSVDPGNWIMVVDGRREFKQWVIPIIARGSAGVSSTAYGPGGCVGPFDGAYGTGSFTWPSSIHTLVGNDFWSGHLALDIATAEGLSILAADSGVVVFAGWANGGYGNTVMIDHGNGYTTLYAHMSRVTTFCGASVGKGQSIGSGGSSGNSTGPHLHFEVRYLGGFINPWFVLPAP